MWDKFLSHYRWFKYGDPSPISYFDIYSPEVIKKNLSKSKIKKIIVILRLLLRSIHRAYSKILIEDRLLIPDEQIDLNAPYSNYYKCSINDQWKNAFCIANTDVSTIKLKVDSKSSGIYFYIGRQVFSKSNADLKIYLKIGNYENTILHKKTEAIHNNWDLFYYGFNKIEKKSLYANKCLELKWKVTVPDSRIFVSPPFVKRNLQSINKIIVLIADAVRPKDLGIYNINNRSMCTPNINELASNGAIFVNSFSQSNWTLPIFASMATSLYASQHNVVNANQYMRVIDRKVPTLAELLKLNNFFTYAEVSHRRCNQSLGHHRGYDNFTYQQTAEEGNSMTKQLRNVCNILRNIKGVSMFIFLHIFDTHTPYLFNKDGVITKNLLNPHPLKYYLKSFKKNETTESELDYIKERYFSKISTLDRELKELLNYVYEDKHATLIVTSDHGFSFKQFATVNPLTDSITRTPFIVYSNRFPIKKGTYTSVVESSIDILPTIVSLCKVDDIYPRSGSAIFDDEFNVTEKDYAISEIIYGEDYQLKIVDIENRYIIFRSSRKRRSCAIDTESISIKDSDCGNLSPIEFKNKFSGYIDSSKLNRKLKAALSKSLSRTYY